MSILKRKSITRTIQIHKQLKKRWVWQAILSGTILFVFLGLIESPGRLGDMVRMGIASSLSLQNDWTPAIQRVISSEVIEAKEERMVLPISGIVVRSYGWYNSPNDNKQLWHGGVDIKAQPGENVKVSADGTVTKVLYDSRNGYSVIVKHKNYLTSVYGNLMSVTVNGDQMVKQGQIIGKVGKSQIHFEIRRRGTTENPLEYLKSNQEDI